MDNYHSSAEARLDDDFAERLCETRDDLKHAGWNKRHLIAAAIVTAYLSGRGKEDDVELAALVEEITSIIDRSEWLEEAVRDLAGEE